MDGIGLRDLPSLAMLAGGLALFAFVALWLVPLMRFARTPQLVWASALWLIVAGNLAFSLLDGSKRIAFNAVFLAVLSYYLWRTWRLRDVI